MPPAASPRVRVRTFGPALLFAGRVRGVAVRRARRAGSALRRGVPRCRGVLALLALFVATVGPPVRAAAGWNVEGLKRRPRMEVQAPATGWSTARVAGKTRRASGGEAPWSHASVLHVEGIARQRASAPARLLSRLGGFRPPSLSAPPAPSRAPPIA
jgi:hypothetical protein